MSHIHKTRNRLLNYLGLTVIVVFGVISTLGTGGGGGGGDGGRPPPIYTGLTTQALITATNAEPLGGVAFLGVTTGSSFSVASMQSAPQDETRSASVVTIVRALHAVVNNIDVASAYSNIPAGWAGTYSAPGNCVGAEGTVSGSLDVNEATGTFTSSLIFTDYCLSPTTDPADGFTMDGNVERNGTCDPATFDPLTQTCDEIDYTMTFTNLNARENGESVTIGGTLASAITVTGYETTVDMRLRDDIPDVTFKFENYLIKVTIDSPTPGIDSIEVSGDAYHPDHGYVVVSTTTPVQLLSDSQGPPESGDVKLTGANGTVGPTTATFTFTGFNTYTVTIDTDGDGATDVTLSCTWDPDTCVMV